MKSTIRSLIWIALIVSAALLCLYVEEQYRSREPRRQLLEYRQIVVAAHAKTEALNAFDKQHFNRLQLEGANNIWVVRTPLIFGAGNWLLYMEFTDARLSALKIRTPDGYTYRPEDAPADVFRP